MDREAESRGTRAEHMARAGALLWEAWRGAQADRRTAGRLPAGDAGRGLRGAGRARGQRGPRHSRLQDRRHQRPGAGALRRGRPVLRPPLRGLRGREPAHRAREHRELLRDRGGVRLRHEPGLGPARRALYARRRAGGGGERASRHRGAGFALHRLALHEGPRPDRRQRHRLPALPRAAGRGWARPRPRGPAGHRPRERRGGERGARARTSSAIRGTSWSGSPTTSAPGA